MSASTSPRGAHASYGCRGRAPQRQVAQAPLTQASASQGVAEPRPGRAPVQLDGARGDAEQVRDLVDGQATEETELDDAGVPLVGFAEPGQGVVDVHEVVGPVLFAEAVVEGQLAPPPAPPRGSLRARMIRQHLPHGPGRDREEVAPPIPAFLLAGQLEPRLVHHGGGLQSMALGLSGEEHAGDDSQLLIDEGQQLLGYLGIVGVEPQDQLSHAVGFGGGHRSSVYQSAGHPRTGVKVARRVRSGV